MLRHTLLTLGCSRRREGLARLGASDHTGAVLQRLLGPWRLRRGCLGWHDVLVQDCGGDQGGLSAQEPGQCRMHPKERQTGLASTASTAACSTNSAGTARSAAAAARTSGYAARAATVQISRLRLPHGLVWGQS